MKKNIDKLMKLIPDLNREREISFSQGFFVFLFSSIFFGLIGITERIPFLFVLSIISFLLNIFIVLSFYKSKKYPKFRSYFIDKDFSEKVLVIFVIIIVIFLGILFVLSSLIRLEIISGSVMNFFLPFYLIVVLLASLSMLLIFTLSLIKSVKNFKNIRK